MKAIETCIKIESFNNFIWRNEKKVLNLQHLLAGGVMKGYELFRRKIFRIGLWCNGSTTGFGSVCPGSNPGKPTKSE